MKRTLIALIAVVGMATAANAATLSVSSDAASYGLGDTITLTVTGDADGASAQAVFARVLYSGSGSVNFVSASQVGMTSFSGGLAWSPGVTAGDASGANALNQLAGLMALAPDTTFSSTVVLTAAGAGTVAISFEGLTGGPTALDFFGLSSGTGGSFTIVPEPTTAGLLGLGLLSLAVAGRRR
jgi:hypothetical protein